MDFGILGVLSLVLLGLFCVVAVAASCWYLLDHIPFLRKIKKTNDKVIPWLASNDFESTALLDMEEEMEEETEDEDEDVIPGYTPHRHVVINIDDIYRPPDAKRTK